MARLTCSYNQKFTGITFTIEVHDRLGDSGDIDFCTGPEGAVISLEGESRNVYQAIQPSSCTFKILIENEDHEAFLEDLALAEENRFWVKVTDGTTRFLGNLIVDEVSIEDSNSDQYWFEVSASDGLADLQNIPYANEDGTPYEGRKRLSEHLANIFSKIPTSDLFDSAYVFTGIFADEMLDQSVCPLEQAQVEHSRFQERTDESIKFWNCYDVLEIILQSFDARIRVVVGSFLIESWNIYVNPSSFPAWVYSDLTFSGGNYGNQSIPELGVCDGTGIDAEAGGLKVYQSPARTVTNTYNYGTGTNWLFGIRFLDADYSDQCAMVPILPTFDDEFRFHFTGTIRSFISADRDPFTNGSRLFFYFKFKFGDQYFTRSFGFSPFWIPSQGIGGSWEPTEDFYRLPQAGNLEYDYETPPLIELNRTDQIDIISTPIPSSESGKQLTVCFSYRIVDRDGNILDFNDYPAIVSMENPSLVFTKEDNTVIEKSSSSITILNTVNNSREFSRAMVFGDGPNPTSDSRVRVLQGPSYVDTTAWSDTALGSPSFPLHELIARSMMARRMNTLLIKEGAIQELNGWLHYIDYDGYTYVPLIGSWETGNGRHVGEWVHIRNGNAWALSSTTLIEEAQRPGSGIPGSVTGGGPGVAIIRQLYYGPLPDININVGVGDILSLDEDAQAAIVWVFRNGAKQILDDSGTSVDNFKIIDDSGTLKIDPYLPYQAGEKIEIIYFL